mmetsp:Transcript_23393/g.68866  ORF Transcript_23393/g.68866 Transcript_23393/m.68866 type:complete len:219 (+) Transcript_23393:180-836(+)
MGAAKRGRLWATWLRAPSARVRHAQGVTRLFCLLAGDGVPDVCGHLRHGARHFLRVCLGHLRGDDLDLGLLHLALLHLLLKHFVAHLVAPLEFAPGALEGLVLLDGGVGEAFDRVRRKDRLRNAVVNARLCHVCTEALVGPGVHEGARGLVALDGGHGVPEPDVRGAHEEVEEGKAVVRERGLPTSLPLLLHVVGHATAAAHVHLSAGSLHSVGAVEA